jgi:hypothetical protein
METRTVTQFHFLTWNELNNPPSAKSVLDFRRYVFMKIIVLFLLFIHLKLMRDNKKNVQL